MNDRVLDLVGRLRRQEADLAAEIVERHWSQQPELASRYGPEGRRHCLEDAAHHLRYLAEAVEANSPVLFADYIEWAGVLLAERNVPSADLEKNIECLQDTLRDELSADQFDLLGEALESALVPLRAVSATAQSALEESKTSELARNYLDAILHGRRAQAVQLIMDAVAEGTSVCDVYLHVFQPVQYEIGRLWQMNRVSVALEHYCTAITQMIMSQLYPQILSGEKTGRVMVCCCIGGDLHEIGSRMIADILELNGWDTHFLGANTPVSGIVQLVRERRADVLALSATMTYHLAKVRETIAAARRECSVRILVGGRPFNLAEGMWRQVGADAWAPDAQEAVRVAAQLLDCGGEP